MAVTVSEGIGVGLLLNGQLVHDGTAMAGEFGHVALNEADEFPFAKKVLRTPADIEWLERPDPRTHGLLPLVVNRLRHLQPRIEAARASTTRAGPTRAAR